MKTTTREILEQEFAKHGLNEEAEKIIPAAIEEEFAEAPAVYVGEIRELFKSLPLEVRKYLHTHEQEVEHSLTALKNAVSFLDQAFGSKGSKKGFKSAKEWVEHLILAEDLIEQNPAVFLPYLARYYGLNTGMPAADMSAAVLNICADNSGKVDWLLNQVQTLLSEVNMLRLGVEAKNQHEAKLLAQAEEAKAAKDAAFSVSGHRSGDENEFRGMTTRQMLERQFAALDD